VITLRKQHNSCNWRISINEIDLFFPWGHETIASFMCNNLAISYYILTGHKEKRMLVFIEMEDF